MPKTGRQNTETEDRLSQLIRLKRSEKPDRAFWTQFDEEIRCKQLAAIVNRQTWRRRLAHRLLTASRKIALPLGIASLLAFAIFNAIDATRLKDSPSSENKSDLAAKSKAAPKPQFEVASPKDARTFETQSQAILPVSNQAD